MSQENVDVRAGAVAFASGRLCPSHLGLSPSTHPALAVLLATQIPGPLRVRRSEVGALDGVVTSALLVRVPPAVEVRQDFAKDVLAPGPTAIDNGVGSDPAFPRPPADGVDVEAGLVRYDAGVNEAVAVPLLGLPQSDQHQPSENLDEFLGGARQPLERQHERVGYDMAVVAAGFSVLVREAEGRVADGAAVGTGHAAPEVPSTELSSRAPVWQPHDARVAAVARFSARGENSLHPPCRGLHPFAWRRGG
jgi:hypothetical protein